MTSIVARKPETPEAPAAASRAPSPAPRRRPTGRTPGQRAYTPWLYILPALILVVGIIYVGIGYTGWVSTLNWNGIDPAGRQVGFGNSAAAAQDPVLWQALGHVAIFGVLTILIQMVLGLIMAILLTSNAVFARPVYKVILFLPVVLAPAAVATAFRGILAPDGQFNGLLQSFGIHGADAAWLADPHFALYSIAAINIWQWTGFSFLLYQAAISQIDQSLFEAAAIDGAGTFKVVRYILLPQLRGTTATLALTGCIGALKTFDIVYLTTGGGPGTSTEFLTTYIYKQVIEQYHAGYSAALSIILLVLALALTAIQIRAYRFGED
jgi:raffinose/stachyose/melibiose transport system permease protein